MSYQAGLIEIIRPTTLARVQTATLLVREMS